MIPTKSNSADKGCSPVSSNCVIWQGPNLSMLSLCTGDTISSVMYKLAQYIVDSGNQNLDVDLSCLTASEVTDKTIENILTLLVTKTCTLEDRLDNLAATPVTNDPEVVVAPCFRELDDYGDPITQILHTEYTKRLGLSLCTTNTRVAGHTTTLTSYGNRITQLEAAVGVGSTEGQITLTCGGNSSPMLISAAIATLENRLCTFRSAVGNETALLSASQKQCANLASATALSAPGTMGALTGWKSTVSTTADSLTNLWLTVCDIRSAFDKIKDFIKPDCSKVTIDFAPALIENGTKVNLFFSGYSSVPTGWVNTDPAGSKLVIKDSLGTEYPVMIDVAAAVRASNPVVISLAGTPLNLATDLVFTLTSKLTYDGVECVKTVIKNIGTSTNTCPTIVVTPAITTMAFSFAPPINTNITYKIELLTSGDTLVSSRTFANPQSVVSDVFTTLQANTQYKIRAVVTVGSLPASTCPATTYSTTSDGTGNTSCGLPPTIISTSMS
jgi:hypothetical protein